MNIFIAGHNGMVGSAILRRLELGNENNIITCSRKELNLLNQSEVYSFLGDHKIQQIYLAAAKVGGIHANNTYRADFIYENLEIQNNIISGAHLNNIDKLLFLGSSCIYPKLCDQPIKEEYLLSGPLELSNEPYAIAKIAGIKLCENFNRQYQRDYRSVMPTNLYGQNDNFHEKNSHVIPALIKKFSDAVLSGEKKVEIWGSGKAKREFLHVDDLAEGCIFYMNIDRELLSSFLKKNISYINIGSGKDIEIIELAKIIQDISGFKGELVFNKEMPDGTPQKVLDITRMKELGWENRISLREGLEDTYSWFQDNRESIKLR
tara:strand:- start:221 stop:1180 length:960 start_codon:yes stop_codon:yes gene_type:complete